MAGRVAPQKFKVTQAGVEVGKWDKRMVQKSWLFGCEASPLSSYHCSSVWGLRVGEGVENGWDWTS